ncbi:adenylosuccinate lyase [Flavitalea sp. BT771]|uniref:adenylosuccinate lyase n=1 Tax=Flavitalea sp. BT771 TaxID=3063329 RepID=UPI0026E21099|nr:adenylosuccinate lyase [Flavitalea sp. BT771]MDO6431420.1 adenylosuccinate lyase [Flavitalea sp. BT771]MDV6220328.1 adenylosuccinate lyase [Flavitalea sp. BT771]
MELNSLTAISPIDGRYRHQVQHLDDYFSEFALIRYRVLVEVEYFQFLAKQKLFPLSAAQRKSLQSAVENFSQEDAQLVKKTEKVTNHDVKAVEYFLKTKIEETGTGAPDIREWVHFGLTSQDINNTAIPLLWKHAVEFEYLPGLLNLKRQLQVLARDWKDVPMLARTHGQPASPTRLGKEIMVFVERLENQVELFIQVPFSAKFGGATGNFNAHYVAFPKKDWVKLANGFVEGTLGLQRQQYTTQIEHYDNLAAHFHAMERINTILIDFCRDIWTYVSMDYFSQKTKKGEIGSSAMPHKVNPIDFENAEGNLGVANALFGHFASKLPVSRLQRDLTDSTVLRNIGVPFAHTILALKSIEKGLEKLVLNRARLDRDLENNWAVVAEAIQTILRRENYPQPYEALKELTRGKGGIDKASIHQFVEKLKVSQALKKELKRITPQNYTGINLP